MIGLGSDKNSMDAVRKIRAFSQLSKYTCVLTSNVHIWFGFEKDGH